MIHDVVANALQYWLQAQRSRAPFWILDVGCGTGVEALQILERLPSAHILCVDHSPRMLEIFCSKVSRAYGNENADGRLAIAQADVMASGWLQRAMAESAMRIEGFSAAVSVYALHHLAPTDKLGVYRSIHEELTAPALFINADLFTFAESWLSLLAQAEEENWIVQNFASPLNAAASANAVLGPRRKELADDWLRHIREENRPLPVTSPRDRTAEDALLSQAGFTGTEILARLYQSAVVVAHK
jgi:SAM-dependent methyltransferase